MTEDADPKPKKTFRQEVVETVQTVVYALMIAFVLRVVLFEPFTIPSASMQPGLLVGDYIIATKWNYGWSKHSIPFSPPLFEGRVLKLGAGPQRGDVVVFKLPRDTRQTYVKRLIGLPGDKIQVTDGVLSVNDKVITRTPAGDAKDPDAGITVAQFRESGLNGHSYMTFDQGPGHDRDDTDVFIVPEDHYFMMGDNRDNSMDSRWPEAVGVGFVPAENLVGKVRLVLVSWKGGANLFNPITWVTRFDPGRIFKPVV
ncbi:signal peptidase I [uncultured Phenylobacterium sp.]|uniref:signal peptidase I n=1 Tax=uncultured Phenylobacterium sp. TaxID=349273 RepID=UPI0025E18023|nr:signal peptidase I [uncultured Phenylobacterium sp.]